MLKKFLFAFVFVFIVSTSASTIFAEDMLGDWELVVCSDSDASAEFEEIENGLKVKIEKGGSEESSIQFRNRGTSNEGFTLEEGRRYRFGNTLKSNQDCTIYYYIRSIADGEEHLESDPVEISEGLIRTEGTNFPVGTNWENVEVVFYIGGEEISPDTEISFTRMSLKDISEPNQPISIKDIKEIYEIDDDGNETLIDKTDEGYVITTQRAKIIPDIEDNSNIMDFWMYYLTDDLQTRQDYLFTLPGAVEAQDGDGEQYAIIEFDEDAQSGTYCISFQAKGSDESFTEVADFHIIYKNYIPSEPNVISDTHQEVSNNFKADSSNNPEFRIEVSQNDDIDIIDVLNWELYELEEGSETKIEDVDFQLSDRMEEDNIYYYELSIENLQDSEKNQSYLLKSWFTSVTEKEGQLNSYRFRVDTTPPVIEFTYEGDKNEDSWLSGQAVVEWSVSDNSGLNEYKYEIRINDEVIHTGELSNEALSFGKDIDEGEYIFELLAEDKAGNIGIATRNLLVDNTPPYFSEFFEKPEGDQGDYDKEVSLETIIEEDEFNATFNWHEIVDDLSGVKEITIILTDKSDSSETKVILDDISTVNYTFEGLDNNKEYSLNLEIKDNAGNKKVSNIYNFNKDEITSVESVLEVSLTICDFTVNGSYNVTKQEFVDIKIQSPMGISITADEEWIDLSAEFENGEIKSFNGSFPAGAINLAGFSLSNNSLLTLTYENGNGEAKFQGDAILEVSNNAKITISDLSIIGFGDNKLDVTFEDAEIEIANNVYNINQIQENFSFSFLSNGLKFKSLEEFSLFETSDFLGFNILDSHDIDFGVSSFKIMNNEITVEIEKSIDMPENSFISGEGDIRGSISYNLDSNDLSINDVKLEGSFDINLKDLANISFDNISIDQNGYHVENCTLTISESFPISGLSGKYTEITSLKIDKTITENIFDSITELEMDSPIKLNENIDMFNGIQIKKDSSINLQKDEIWEFVFSGSVVLPELFDSKEAGVNNFSIDTHGNISLDATIDITDINLVNLDVISGEHGPSAFLNILYEENLELEFVNAVFAISDFIDVTLHPELISLNEDGILNTLNASLRTGGQKNAFGDWVIGITTDGEINFQISEDDSTITFTDGVVKNLGDGIFREFEADIEELKVVNGQLEDFTISVPIREKEILDGRIKFTDGTLQFGKTENSYSIGVEDAEVELDFANLNGEYPVTIVFNEGSLNTFSINNLNTELPMFGDQLSVVAQGLEYEKENGNDIFTVSTTLEFSNVSLDATLKIDASNARIISFEGSSDNASFDINIGSGFEANATGISVNWESGKAKITFGSASFKFLKRTIIVSNLSIDHNGNVTYDGIEAEESFEYEVAGCKFTLRNPSLEDGRIKFLDAEVSVFGSLSQRVDGVSITRDGDIHIDGGAIKLPSFSIGGMELEDLMVEFGKHGNDRYYGGSGHVTLPGMGGMSCGIRFQENATFFNNRVQSANFELTLNKPIPLGSTGLELKSIKGGLYGAGTVPSGFPMDYRGMFGEDWRLAELGIGVVDATGGSILSADATIWVELKDWDLAFQGNATILEGLVSGQVNAAYASSIFAADATIRIVFVEGNVNFYVFKVNDRPSISGDGSVSVKIPRGQITNRRFLKIPRKDRWFGEIEAKFGLFTNNKKGVQGSVRIPVLGRVSAFAGTGGIKLRSNYNIYNPLDHLEAQNQEMGIVLAMSEFEPVFSALDEGSGTQNNNNMERTFNIEGEKERIVFAIFHKTEDELLYVPSIEIIAPNGEILKLDNDNIEYSLCDELFLGAVLNPDEYEGTQWTINISGNDHEVVLLAKDHPTELSHGNVSGNNVDINVSNAPEEESNLSVFLAEIIDGEEGEQIGFEYLVSETISVLEDGSYTISIDTSKVPGGKYRILSHLEWDMDEDSVDFVRIISDEIIEIENLDEMVKVENVNVLVYSYENNISNVYDYEGDISKDTVSGYGLAVEFEDIPTNPSKGYIISLTYDIDGEESYTSEINVGNLKYVRIPGFERQIIIDEFGNKTKEDLHIELSVKPYVYHEDSTYYEPIYVYGPESDIVEVVIKEELQPYNIITDAYVSDELDEITLETIGTKETGTAYDYALIEIISVPMLEEDNLVTLIFENDKINISKGETFKFNTIFNEIIDQPILYELQNNNEVTLKVVNMGDPKNAQEITFEVRYDIPNAEIDIKGAIYPGIVISEENPDYNTIQKLWQELVEIYPETIIDNEEFDEIDGYYETINSMSGGRIRIYGSNLQNARVFLKTVENSYEPLSIVRDESSKYVLTVDIPAGLSPGLYKIKVLGNSDSFDNTENVFYVAIVEPSVSITEYKTTGNINPGESSDFYIAINAQEGYLGYVDLSLENVPQGWEVSFDKTSAMDGQVVKITVNVPEGEALGEYNLKINSEDLELGTLDINVTDSYINPFIQSLSKTSAYTEERIIVYGEGFGESGSLELNGTELIIESYDNSKIQASIPDGVASGELNVITDNDSQSNSVNLYILKYGFRIIPSRDSIILYPGETVTLPFNFGGADNQNITGLEAVSDSIFVDAFTEDDNVTVSVLNEAELGVYRVSLRGWNNNGYTEDTFKVYVVEPEHSSEDYSRGITVNPDRTVDLWFEGKEDKNIEDVSLETLKINGQSVEGLNLNRDENTWWYSFEILPEDTLLTYKYIYTRNGIEYETDTFDYLLKMPDWLTNETLFDISLEGSFTSDEVNVAVKVNNSFSPSFMELIYEGNSIPMVREDNVFRANVGVLEEGSFITLALKYGDSFEITTDTYTLQYRKSEFRDVSFDNEVVREANSGNVIFRITNESFTCVEEGEEFVPQNVKIIYNLDGTHIGEGIFEKKDSVWEYNMGAISSGTEIEYKLLYQKDNKIYETLLRSYQFKDEGYENHLRGLLGEYFTDTVFTDLKMALIDKTIDFGDDGVKMIDDDCNSVRWTGKLQTEHSGTHTFYVTTDGGVKVWINNDLVINSVTSSGISEFTADVELIAGVMNDIVIEFQKVVGNGNIKLEWSNENISRMVIPQERFLSIIEISDPVTPIIEDMKLLYKYNLGDQYSEHIQPEIQIINTSNEPINLSEVKARYWLMHETGVDSNLIVYWTNCQGGEDNVQLSSVMISAERVNSNQYVEIAFNEQAGYLEPGESVNVLFGFNANDWSTFNQHNDHSFDQNASSFIENERITIYSNNSLIWGEEPLPKDAPEDLIDIKVLQNQQKPDIISNSISLNVRLLNEDQYGIDLSKLTLRYYYTKDSELDDIVEKYWASFGIDNLTVEFKEDANGHTYIEIGFSEESGAIAPTEFAEFNFNVRDENWSQSFNQGNDYSFDNSSPHNFIENDKIICYYNGYKVYGIEP
ncbi:cellulose binding domain-containing protein [Herbivorax sp. ANBcel31]|uniref:cellulose binding domain-containing protein n=1 Tax=Herbivorax sp. ANBcel31 TaxID=3069754 RepID=UPI0027B13D8D|nr:cellulose binding domain-containing protein [Herbivorax sp. ANBcel31]MDQ2087630.1 cellulose binding domain-containing protein [Herbivorax sp. ANBcel31]